MVQYKPLPMPEKQSSAITTLKGRGISEDTQKRFRLFERDSKIFRGQREIGFPYIRNGEVYACKFRTDQKKFHKVKDRPSLFYNEDVLKTATTVCITEGEIDALSFIEAGFENTVSIPDGGSEGRMNFDFLAPVEEALREVDEFIIAADNDFVGSNTCEELVRRLGRGRCLRVVYPDGCKDANEVLVKHGKDAVSGMINSAQPYPINTIITAKSVKRDMDNIREGVMRRGISTGLKSLDEYYTIQEGEWTLITGIPSMGKSGVLDQFVINLAKNSQWKFGIFTPENTPPALYFTRLCARYVQKPFRGNYQGLMTKDEYESAVEWLDSRFFIYDMEEPTLESILDTAKQLVYRDGIQGLIIDPWNEIDHKRESGESETEYISRAISKIRRFTKEYKLHTWVVAHPTKQQKRVYKREGEEITEYPVPDPYSISGSAHWWNKGENCLTVHRDFSIKNRTQIHIQKIKQRDTGKVGELLVGFREDDETFYDL